MSLDQVFTQPVIEAERFVLRPLRKSDEGLLSQYTGDERVARMTSSIPHPVPPGATEAYIARAMSDDREEDVWAIDGTRDGGAELKGVIGLKRLDRNQSEVGFWIAPVFWNSGLASEALKALVDANPSNNAAMFATAFQDNLASAKVLTHCGFEYLGDAETFSVSRGAAVPTWTYSRKL
ncbi:GNAT family N-acetyltransferase [Sedimentitalea sp. CY04]|uniref:GNAT family N-acetyltransferase n=1 Tax=Parasedimentitalea denitrificans TaxID=2211118 RepID=A0ABX0WAQ8_9RHOB|nr:GNAT family N-acetyltransferase [Sedimentitalea sp. CY04]NIZ62754.1 GNAT family N-acetyltransferase [Sedimentitalea sp. CY04]